MTRGPSSALLLVLAAPAAAQEPAVPVVMPVTVATPGSATGVLVRQGQRWLDQGRPELARLSVQRALAAEPRNLDGLLLAIRIEAAETHRDAVAVLTARLRAAGGTPDQLAAADAELRSATMDRAGLEEARRLARENKPDEAVAAYRRAFGQNEPPASYAREFNQTLAGTSAGRQAGQRALGQLAAQPGADDRTLLANAEQLTYTPSTRTDGIRRLSDLASKPGIGPDAQRAWRQALTFYQGDPAGTALLEDYMRRYPGDADIQQRLTAARAVSQTAPPSPGDALRREGFAELEAGGLRTGAERFEAALALNPKDADALGGLGVIRLRENRPADARGLLQRAVDADPAKAGQWRKALDGAEYALELAEARGLLRRNDVAAADTVLRRTVRRDVQDSTDAESMLGEVAQRRGDATEAEQHFRAVIARRPGFGPAITGLAQALRSQGRVAEANVLRPPVAAGPGGGGGASLNPEVARLRAEATRATDPVTEVGLLNAAMAGAPNDPWLRLDLARTLGRMGRGAEGRALVEELAARSPTPDASYAAALFAQESGHPADAEAFLARIPPQRRSADVSRLAARVRNQAEVSRAAALLPSAPADARRRLLLLAAQADPTGGTAADVVRALGEAGDTAGATEAARVAEATNRAAPARIAVAGALLRAGLDAEANAVASRVEAGPLTAPQQRDLVALRTNAAVRAADRLNEAGDQASAYERLRPALASNAGEPAVELALARLYQGARRPAEALRIAEAVLARNPANPDAQRGALEAAIAAGDRRRAEAIANDARARAPGDSRATFLQARVARGFGDDSRARTLLQEAAAQRQQEIGSTVQIDAATEQAAANPFARTGSGIGTGTPVLVVSQDRVSRDIAQELAEVRSESATRISGGAVVRVRSGVAGLDSLTELAAPLEASGSFAGGRLTALVTPTYLDSGRLASSGDPALRFGTAALATTPVSPAGTTATGVGLGLGYRRGEAFAIDIGTSPLGFHTTNVIGGIEIAPKLSDTLRLRVRAERRSVLDSLLSYAGQRDPITGQSWGGVTQTGGRVQLDATVGAGSAYVLGGYATLEGENVARNNRREAGAGFSYPVWKQGNASVTAGLDLVYFGYDNNQRGFSFGQGGYFSPQSFVALNLPVEYRSKLGDLAYRLGATVGYDRFREEASPLFPNNPFLQAQVEAANKLNPLIPAHNAGQNKNGLTGGVRVDLEYPLTETLSLVGSAHYDKSADFEETRVTVRLENRF